MAEHIFYRLDDRAVKIACVLITHLPAKAEARRNSALRDRPFLITAQSGGGARVLDHSPRLTGVSGGMPLQEALSRCGDASLIEADEAYYSRVFDQTVGRLQDKSPVIEKGEVGCVFLDMRGTEGMHGGDAGIARSLLNAVPDDLGPRVGLAQSKFPAYVAAHTSKPGRATRVSGDPAAFLEDLSLDLLPLSWEDRVRLHGFGIHTMGQGHRRQPRSPLEAPGGRHRLHHVSHPHHFAVRHTAGRRGAAWPGPFPPVSQGEIPALGLPPGERTQPVSLVEEDCLQESRKQEGAGALCAQERPGVRRYPRPAGGHAHDRIRHHGRARSTVEYVC